MVVKVALKILENTVLADIVLDFHSSAVEDVRCPSGLGFGFLSVAREGGAHLNSCGQEVVFPLLHPDVNVPSRERVSLQFGWSPICISICTSKMSILESGSIREVFCDVVSESFQEVITLANGDQRTVF